MNRFARLPGYLVVSRGDTAILSFDREYRLFHAWLKGHAHRIGFDGRVVEVRGGDPESLPHSHPFGDAERACLFEGVRNELKILAGIPDSDWTVEGGSFIPGPEARAEAQKCLEALEPERLKAQWEALKKLYLSVPILPPDCYRSLLVQLTHGCAYNRCTFCSLYDDRAFRVRTESELEDHLDAILSFQGQAMPRWSSVFLGEANALGIEQKTLAPLLGCLRRVMADSGHKDLTKNLYSFADAANDDRTSRDYHDLWKLGLRRVYVGLETGDWELRKTLKKPGTQETFFAKVERLKKAEVGVGVILMAGVGGVAHAEAHVRASLDVIARLGLDKNDIVFVSPLRNQEAPYPLSLSTFESGAMTEEETWIQANRLMADLRRTTGPKGPKLAVYDIERFTY